MGEFPMDAIARGQDVDRFTFLAALFVEPANHAEALVSRGFGIHEHHHAVLADVEAGRSVTDDDVTGAVAFIFNEAQARFRPLDAIGGSGITDRAISYSGIPKLGVHGVIPEAVFVAILDHATVGTETAAFPGAVGNNVML